MKLPLGFELTVRKAIPSGLQLSESRGGWWPLIRESFTGAWQQNVETPMVDVLSHPTVFACITLIAGDTKKCRYDFVRKVKDDIWIPDENPAFSPVLRTPNGYEDPEQFREHWMISKLESGNTYVLKQRDQRGVVVALYILNPWRVRPLEAPDGSVFYELQQDRLSTQDEGVVVVPAREIIHDRFNCLFHPLVGISPLYAAGIPAILGLRIQTGSTHFFGNSAIPAGILTTPGMIDKTKATALREQWETQYGGVNQGRIAVLGDGMKFEPMAQAADKSQLDEQWLRAAEAIAVCFHVPFFLVGGPMPPYNNVQTLTIQYFQQCLQPLWTALETTLGDGIGLRERINGVQYGVQFNKKDLLLMDSLTMMDVISKGIMAGVLAPNEGRADLNLLPVEGGDMPMLQNQMWPLSQLAERPSPSNPAPAAPDMPTVDSEDIPADAMSAAFQGYSQKAWELTRPSL